MRIRSMIAATATAVALIGGTAAAAPAAPAAQAAPAAAPAVFDPGYTARSCAIDSNGARLSVTKWRVTSATWKYHIDLNSSSYWDQAFINVNGKQDFGGTNDLYYYINASSATIKGTWSHWLSKKSCSITM